MTFSELVLPERNYFGEDAVERIADELTAQGIRRILILSDQGVRTSGLLGLLEPVFTDAGIEVSIDSSLSGEPTLNHVLHVLETFASVDAEALVGIGGGSVLDISKAVALGATNGPDLRARVGYNKHTIDPIPFYLVSTAAGTAAELSRAFIITDESTGEKLILKDDRALPRATACNHHLMTGLPSSVTAAGGMDALAHALEGYLGKKSWGLSRALGLAAARLVLDNLQAAVDSPTNLDHREALVHAQTLAGMSLGSAGVGMGHAIGHPLGSRMHMAHGVAVGMLLPYVLRYNFKSLPDTAKELAQGLLGPDGTPAGVIDAVASLARGVGIAAAGRGRALEDADIDWIVDHAAVEANLPNSAVTPSKLDIREVLTDAWEGREL